RDVFVVCDCWGALQTIMMGAAAIDLAEEGGYVLVAPMGYNISGWYRSSAFAPAAGRGNAKDAPYGAKGPHPAAAPGGDEARKGGFGGAANQPANVREL